MTAVGGPIEIYDNSALMSLTGIDNIEAGLISDYLLISYNSSLSTCEVQSICDYLASPNCSIGIYENVPGCNSVEEVEEAREALSVSKLNVESDISFYPNPANKSIAFINPIGTKI